MRARPPDQPLQSRGILRPNLAYRHTDPVPQHQNRSTTRRHQSSDPFAALGLRASSIYKDSTRSVDEGNHGVRSAVKELTLVRFGTYSLGHVLADEFEELILGDR